MAFNYIVHHYLSPRIMEVLSEKDITVQEVIDACRDWEDSEVGMSFLPLIDAAGKEALGGGVTVGITATLLNTNVMFSPRSTPLDDGTGRTCDATDTTGKELYVDDADFVSDGVEVGDTVYNTTTGAMASITAVVDQYTLQHFELSGGSSADWTSSDNYKVYSNERCSVTGGNLVAVDSVGAEIEAFHPTPNVYLKTTSSSSATLQELGAIQYSSFGGGVTLDTVGGTAGTEFPIGTIEAPVSNLTDAMTIASSRGFNTLFVIGDLSVGGSDDYSGMIFQGESQTKTTFTIAAGVNVFECEFYDGTVTGTLDGNAKLRNCIIDGLDYINGVVEQCILEAATITLGGSAVAHFLDCWSGVPGTGTPVIDMGGSGQALALRNYNGGIALENKTGTESVSIDLNSGQIKLKDTVTNGTIVCRGVGKLIDFDTDEIIHTGSHNGATILNETLSSHNITDAVWDEPISDHVTAGTYGEELATKADIASGASTVQIGASSGTVVYGTETSGTYANTASKDNSYWQITEDASDGLIVEMTFYITDADCRPGAFNMFGRYEGVPSATHHQELWAYNYETLTWEELLDDFLPGGNTSDASYSHEYYERHIDRTNNGEVKIRIIHHITTYSGSHNLYIDYADISCIEVITAADIADAVWDEIISDHRDTGSASEHLRKVKWRSQ